jgi:hypothetical protein
LGFGERVDLSSSNVTNIQLKIMPNFWSALLPAAVPFYVFYFNEY